ncbi:MAG: hypothetical protein NTY81_01360 [Candidatus Staskawiczbacteria bacterium]|nr:hypothetical protein [Candidatus Staskawiczbacteria bacterium]
MKTIFSSKFISLFLFSGFALFSFPILTFSAVADHVQIGSECQGSINQNQTCNIIKDRGQTLVHLKWDLSGYYSSGKVQTCQLEKNYPSQYDTKRHFYSIGIYKDSKDVINNNLPVSVLIPLKVKDDVWVPAPTGQTNSEDIYQIDCWDKYWYLDKSISTKSTNPANEQFGPEKDVKLVESCEVPFASIAKDLNHNILTDITENSFRDWASDDTEDSNSIFDPVTRKTNPFGSGDKTDIIRGIIYNQCTTACPIPPSDITWKTAISDLEKIIPSTKYPNKKDAEQLSLVFHDANIPYNHTGNHSVIATFVTDPGDGTATITYLDPNGPTNNLFIYCGRKTDNIPADHTDKWCFSPKGNKFVNPFVDTVDAQQQANLSSARNNFINSNQNFCSDPKHSDYCKRDINQWIRTNYPDINNFSVTNLDLGGCCKGWTDFVMRVAYLGDFVGYDYHPNDGKYVNQDCDANHYPLPTKSAFLDSTNFLGSILTPIINFFAQK